MALFVECEWADVQGVPQDDGPAPLVSIAYTPEFRQLMDYFRAALVLEEYSGRTLRLTEAILEHNAANYTVWQYRRDCLKATGADLRVELAFVDTFASDNPKNYQIWNHRRVIVEELGDASRELAFTQIVFLADAKNYHAWAHRQWALRSFGLDWAAELAYTEQLILTDVRNNSAWNQRWFVVHNRADAGAGTEAGTVSQATYDGEYDFVWSRMQQVRKNESAWNYLRGLAAKCAALRPRALEICEQVIADARGAPQSSPADSQEVDTEGINTNTFALALAADLWEQMGAAGGDAQILQKARAALQTLADTDRIRVKAWSSRLAALPNLA